MTEVQPHVYALPDGRYWDLRETRVGQGDMSHTTGRMEEPTEGLSSAGSRPLSGLERSERMSILAPPSSPVSETS